MKNFHDSDNDIAAKITQKLIIKKQTQFQR